MFVLVNRCFLIIITKQPMTGDSNLSIRSFVQFCKAKLKVIIINNVINYVITFKLNSKVISRNAILVFIGISFGPISAEKISILALAKLSGLNDLCGGKK